MAWRFWASVHLDKCNALKSTENMNPQGKSNRINGQEMMKISNKKQLGGTLLGLVIGVLLGLGVALAVAVYVTKVPITFLNKSQPHNAENDAAETKKNKDWDPNSPLAGKKPVIPNVIPPEAAGAAVVTPPVGAPAIAEIPVTAPSTPAKAKASADPLGDLAKAKMQGKPEAAPSSAGSGAVAGADLFSYYIQAGAFRTPEDAEQQRVKLSLAGFQAKVSEREQAGRTVYRVRLGPFDKKDEADTIKVKLDANAIETALVRVQR